jgi:hypothetical protein
VTHREEQLRRLKAGLLATLVTTLLTAAIWGRKGVVGGATFGLIATGLQLLAARVMRRTGVTPSVDHLGVYTLGVLLRVMGVVALGLLVTKYPGVFDPGACAVGYLGAVLPLLYVETRLSR